MKFCDFSLVNFVWASMVQTLPGLRKLTPTYYLPTYSDNPYLQTGCLLLKMVDGAVLP